MPLQNKLLVYYNSICLPGTANCCSTVLHTVILVLEVEAGLTVSITVSPAVVCRGTLLVTSVALCNCETGTCSIKANYWFYVGAPFTSALTLIDSPV